MQEKLKILIADDQQIFLDGLQAILAREQDIEVIGEACNGKQVLYLLQQQTVDIAVLDIDMPEMNGVELAEQMSVKYPGVKILVLTAHDRPQWIDQLMQFGIKGYILKSKGSEQLVQAIRAIAGGETYYGQELFHLFAQVRARKNQASEVVLTSREEEVLRLIAREYTTPQIAEKLFIAPSTVETHRRNLIAKTGVKSTLGLVRWAVERGLG